MAVTVSELFESRAIETDVNGTKTMTRLFRVSGEKDPFTAEGYGPALGSTFGADLTLRKKRVKRKWTSKIDGDCELECDYSTEDPDSNTGPGIDQESIEMDLTAATAHVDRARTQFHYPPAADVGDLIGVNGDAIEGTDKYVPSGMHIETHWVTTVTAAWLDNILSYRSKVNSVAWRYYQDGEVLFLGITLRKTTYTHWQVQYKFLISRNESVNVPLIGGGSVSVPKKGHEYIWFKKAITDVAGQKHWGVKSAHLVRHYEEVNFSGIGIGN